MMLNLTMIQEENYPESLRRKLMHQRKKSAQKEVASEGWMNNPKIIGKWVRIP